LKRKTRLERKNQIAEISDTRETNGDGNKKKEKREIKRLKSQAVCEAKSGKKIIRNKRFQGQS